jgi:hypothetical protein
MEHDDHEPKPGLRSLSDTPMLGCPTDYPAQPVASQQTREAARREYGRRICEVRVQRASDGKPLEGPLADWPGGVL